jgi:hypothetical protein
VCEKVKICVRVCVNVSQWECERERESSHGETKQPHVDRRRDSQSTGEILERHVLRHQPTHSTDGHTRYTRKREERSPHRGSINTYIVVLVLDESAQKFGSLLEELLVGATA